MADKSTEEKTGTISLIDGKQNYRRKQPVHERKNSCSASRLWIFFTVLFFLTTVLAIAAFVWRYSFYQEPVINTEFNNTQTYKRFKGFFRTSIEQQRFERQFYIIEEKEMVTINKTAYTNNTCFVTCRKRQLQGEQDQPIFSQLQQATLGNVHYHACCISETYFISPETLPGIDGTPKTIAHFDDDDQRQYFQSQECHQAAGCTGCQCTQIIDTHTALIEDPTKDEDDDDKYTVEFVKVPGCCKCLNS